MLRGRRSTPEGEHRPVLLDEVLAALEPRPGAIVVDCTVGWAGHAVELLKHIGKDGRLIGLDLDAENLPRSKASKPSAAPLACITATSPACRAFW
jgi:16S rRNA (cytosine1402-N4)-methyltransferase